MGRRRDSLLRCLACVGAYLIPVGVANAASGFVPAETLPASGSADSGVQTAMAPNGFAIAGWVETVNSTHTAIRVATRPPGGRWSAPQQLDVTAQPQIQTRYPLSVAINSAGDAVVAWDDEQVGSPTTDAAMVATKHGPQSAFGTPQKLAGAADPVAGIDATGHVTMVDIELDGASHDLVDRVWAAGGAASAIRTDAVATDCRVDLTESALAVAPSGNAIAAAQCTGDTFIRRIAGTWKSPSRPVSDFSDPGNCFVFVPPTSATGQDMTVAIDAAGDVAAAFVENNSTQDCTTSFPSSTTTLGLLVGTAPGGVTSAGTVDTATSFDFSTGSSISGPDIAIAPGKILLGWTNGGLISAADDVRSFDGVGSPAGPAQPLVTTGAGSFLGHVQVAMSPNGGMLAVFPTPNSTAVQAAVRGPGAAAFAAPIPLAAAPSAAPGVAMDDAGDGVAVYDSGHTGTALAQARGFDATPPVIGAASIPSVSPSGKRVSFTAGALDFWGPTTLSWNFGDGSAAASGSPVTHIFTRSGSHTVTVTVTDAVGNTAQKSGSISVVTPKSVLTHASVKPKRFKAGHTAVFSFTLNEAARVTIALARRYVPRHRRGKHPKPRFAAAGNLATNGKAGLNHLRFAGRIGKRKLPPGRYRATFTAVAGRVKSKPVTLSFTITRAK